MGHLGPSARIRLARILGRLVATLAPARRDLALENLKRAFPEWTDRERLDLLPAAYTNLIAFGLETLAMDRLSHEQIQSQVIVSEATRDAFAQLHRLDKGFVFLSGHFGNWEWTGAWVTAQGFRIGGIVKPQHEPAGDEFINSIRRKIGIQLFDTRSSQLGTMRHLKKGGVIAMLSDQDARRSGIFVPFFGELASTAPGAAWFARKLGVPIVPVFGYRRQDGRFRFEAGDPIWPDPELSEDEDIRRLTALHVKALEEAIRADPSQYLWFHRRWKTRPKAADLEELAQGSDAKADVRADARTEAKPGALATP